MSYATLSTDKQVLLAIEFIATGAEIPSELVGLLGDDMIFEISNPILGVLDD